MTLPALQIQIDSVLNTAHTFRLDCIQQMDARETGHRFFLERLIRDIDEKSYPQQRRNMAKVLSLYVDFVLRHSKFICTGMISLMALGKEQEDYFSGFKNGIDSLRQRILNDGATEVAMQESLDALTIFFAQVRAVLSNKPTLEPSKLGEMRELSTPLFHEHVQLSQRIADIFAFINLFATKHGIRGEKIH